MNAYIFLILNKLYSHYFWSDKCHKHSYLLTGYPPNVFFMSFDISDGGRISGIELGYIFFQLLLNRLGTFEGH